MLSQAVATLDANVKDVYATPESRHQLNLRTAAKSKKGEKLMALIDSSAASEEEQSQKEFDKVLDDALGKGDQLQAAVHSMDNLNLNKELGSQLQDAHDNLINASQQEHEEGDEQAGFMKKYSDKVSTQRSVIK